MYLSGTSSVPGCCGEGRVVSASSSYEWSKINVTVFSKGIYMTISRFFLNFQCQLQNETDFTVYLHVFLNGLVSMFVCFSRRGTRDGYIVMFREWIRFSLILSPITGLSLTLLYTTHEEIVAWKRGQGRRTVDPHRETNLTRYHHGLCRERKFLKFVVSRLSEMAFKEPSLPLSLVPFINPFIWFVTLCHPWVRMDYYY